MSLASEPEPQKKTCWNCGGLIAAKTLSVVAVEILQAVVVCAVALALGWHPHGDPVSVVVLLLLGTAAFSGFGLLMAGIAWYVMQTLIIRRQGPDSPLRRAIGRDLKGKLSPLVYLAGIVAAFFSTAVSDLLYLGVALMWLIPDRRVETVVSGRGSIG